LKHLRFFRFDLSKRRDGEIETFDTPGLANHLQWGNKSLPVRGRRHSGGGGGIAQEARIRGNNKLAGTTNMSSGGLMELKQREGGRGTDVPVSRKLPRVGDLARKRRRVKSYKHTRRNFLRSSERGGGGHSKRDTALAAVGGNIGILFHCCKKEGKWGVLHPRDINRERNATKAEERKKAIPTHRILANNTMKGVRKKWGTSFNACLKSRGARGGCP